MTIHFHPLPGTILICDFKGFITPEMVKRRPVVVVSPRFRERDNLCTVIPLSTTAPKKVMDYHFQLTIDPPLPSPISDPNPWVKGDMLTTVSFKRLKVPFDGKDDEGKRRDVVFVLDEHQLREVKRCALYGIGFPDLTGYL